MNRRRLLALVLAFLIPGAGHFYLHRRARGVAFFAIVAFLFVTGLSIEGGLYTLAESQGQLMARLAVLASMGSGVLYFLGNLTGPHGSVWAATFEYGRTFTLTAGLMNLLLVLDCWDLASVRPGQETSAPAEQPGESLP